MSYSTPREWDNEELCTQLNGEETSSSLKTTEQNREVLPPENFMQGEVIESDDQHATGEDSDVLGGNSGRECWLCRDGMSSQENPLVTNVCRCRGSVGWIHRECIDGWVFSQRRSNCPGCGATYNVLSSSTLELPQTFFGEICFLFYDLFLPLSAKMVSLVAGVFFNGIVVPFFIGVAFYHWNVFSSVSAKSFYTNVTTLSNISSSVMLQSDIARASELKGTWLWFSIMVYGWICVTLWRCTKTGWEQWCALFTQDGGLEAETKREPYTMVESAHWFMDYCLEWTGCSRNMVFARMLELAGLVPVSIVLSFFIGRVLVVLALIFGMIFWRIRYPRKKIHNITRRFAEVQERKDSATEWDIALWFFTYVCELALFSIVMAVCGGIVLHFALSPYLIAFPASFEMFFSELSLIRLAVYWFFGTLCSMVLLHVETMIVVPLFAPGVELFFVRSVDLDLESSTNYWNFILAQVFDADPLRVFFDFFRLLIIEMTVLYVFLATPLYVAFNAHDMIVKGDIGDSGLALPISFGFPVLLTETIINKSLVLPLELIMKERKPLATETGIDVDFFSYEFGLNLFCRFVLALFQWLLRHPFLFQCIMNALIVIGVGTVFACMRIYPVRHMQLKILRPLSMWIACHIVHMEAFLFDADRLSFLDRWLCGDGQDDIPMPEVPISLAFVRREWTLPEGYARPKFLKLRLALFSTLFFVISSVMFWTVPVAVMTLLLFFLPYSVPLLCVLTNLLFFVLNPRMYFSAVSTFMLFCVILFVGLFVQPVVLCLPLKNISRQQLIRETVEFHQNVKRTVGVYHGEPEETDEWESVSSSDVDLDIMLDEEDIRQMN